MALRSHLQQPPCAASSGQAHRRRRSSAPLSHTGAHEAALQRCSVHQQLARAWRRGTAALKASATADAVTTPLGSSDGLIFPRGPQGSWDEGGVGQPVVRCFVGDNEERWFMWYSGRKDAPQAAAPDLVAPSSGTMGVAISGDGIRWQRGQGNVEGERGERAAADVGASIGPSGDWWTFDTHHVSVSDVQVLSSSSVQSGVGVYWCFYAGGDYQPVPVPEGLPGAAHVLSSSTSSASSVDEAAASAPPPGEVEGLRMRPGLAMSQDARNWARIEGDHHTGALFDVGQPGEWDELFIGSPQVVAMGPRDMRMFYHSWDRTRQRFVVGGAASQDGFRWAKQGVLFDPVEAGAGPQDHDAGGAATCSVARDVDNRQYLMFYEAVAKSGRRSIGLAVSKDGRKWKRCPTPLLQATSQPQEQQQPAAAEGRGAGWDAGSVGAPCGVSMAAGKWRLYYAGRQQAEPGPWQGIGLALSMDEGQTFEKVPVTFRRVPAGTAAPLPEAAADGGKQQGQ